MNKKYEEIFKKLEMDKIIENENEADLYKQVYEDLLNYLKNNGKATFQEIIKYVNGSDRRTLRMLDQLVNLKVLKFEYPFFTLASSDVTKTRLTPDAVRCPTCDSKMINLGGELKHITEIMKKIYEKRFTPTFIFDQRPVNYKTSVRRAGYMILRGDIRDKRIAVLGDDDLTSIAIGLTRLPKEIVVFDIDKRIIDYIDEISTKYDIKNIKAVYCDLTKGIPEKYRNHFDLFTTDPTPTSKPFTVFINKGMELLKNKAGMVGYSSIYPSCKLKDISIQKILTSMGLMITDLIPYWTQYEYIRHTYNKSDLELEKKYAANQSKISFFEYLLRFETTKESKTLDIDYRLKDIIGTATERVLADFRKDPTLGTETKDKKYIEEVAEYLKREISKDKRRVLDIHITGHCNMNCEFCCGAPKNLEGPNLKDFERIVDKIVGAGVTTLVFTGGEPLLKPHIERYLEYAKIKGLEVYLSTNGLLLSRELYRKIAPYIDVLGLPLDGSSTEMNVQVTRGRELFRSTTKHLKDFYKNPPKHIVKIGTVVTKINKEDIVNIGNILYNTPESYRPDVWRIYEFSPLGEGLKNRRKFEISEKEFIEVVNKVKAEFPNQKISVLTNSDSDNSYFFINPKQELEVLTNNIYKPLGRINEMSSETIKNILEKYKSVVKRGSRNREWLTK